MSKSSSLRISDYRRIHQILNECCDLGNEAELWRTHLSQYAAQLVDADFGSSWSCAGVGGEEIVWGGISEWGWENGFDREGWTLSVTGFVDDPFFTPMHSLYIDRTLVDDGCCLARTDLMQDQEWYHSWMFQNINRVMGVDHFLWCWKKHELCASDTDAITIVRSNGRKDFSGREKAIIQLLQELMSPRVGWSWQNFKSRRPVA